MQALSSSSGRSVLDPAGEPVAPLGNRQAARRIAGHHLALAAREAAGAQALVDAPPQLQPALAVAGRILAFEHQAIVLVGHDGLLAAALRAERQPACPPQIQLLLAGDDLQHAIGQPVVEMAEQFAHLARAHVMTEQVAGKRPHAVRRLGELLDAAGGGNRAADPAKRLFREQPVHGPRFDRSGRCRCSAHVNTRVWRTACAAKLRGPA